jgi:hypothetical protein
VARRAAIIPLKDERFCVGPDTRLPMRYGRRSQLDVDGDRVRRLLPFFIMPLYQPIIIDESAEVDGYQYQEQSPSAHIENLKSLSSHRIITRP